MPVAPQGREKINLVYLFTKMGFSILVSDVDTVWMRNPLPYMAQYPEADVLTSSDHLVWRCLCLCHAADCRVHTHMSRTISTAADVL